MAHINDDEFQQRTAIRNTRRRATNERPLRAVERIGCTTDSYNKLLERDRRLYGSQRWYQDLDRSSDD